MANNIKYAQNLIGDWNKDIYEPKKQALQDIYQTNWNKLSNDYNTLKDTLARNYDVARQTYNKTLGDIQNESFNRMNAATIDLANRGLSSSGVTGLVNNADTQIKGEEVNKALSSLLDTEAGNEKSLFSGLNTLGQQENSLASGLLGDIGGLTDADAANNQQYAGLVGNIAESAASRAASRAASGSGQDNSEEDEIERRFAIARTLESEDYSEEEKVNLLVRYLDVPLDKAKSAVSAYTYDIANNKLNNAIKAYDKASNTRQKEKDIVNKYSNYMPIIPGFVQPGVVARALVSDNNPLNIANSIKNSRLNAVNKARENLSKYTYGDIYDILYGGK